jgi:hypothetical protein
LEIRIKAIIYIKINCRPIKDINVKNKTIEILKEQRDIGDVF